MSIAVGSEKLGNVENIRGCRRDIGRLWIGFRPRLRGAFFAPCPGELGKAGAAGGSVASDQCFASDPEESDKGEAGEPGLPMETTEEEEPEKEKQACDDDERASGPGAEIAFKLGLEGEEDAGACGEQENEERDPKAA